MVARRDQCAAVRRAARILSRRSTRLAWLLVPHYLVAQSLFFLGAAWFRKTHFVKTVGAVVALAIGLCAIAIGIAWLLGAANWGGGNMRIDGDFDGSVYRPLEWLADVSPGYLLLRAAAVLLVRCVAARDRDAGEPWNLANRRAFTSRSPTRCAIASWPGEWHEGERIPSVRELAVGVGVNPNTVTKSYQALLDREIIENQRGLGYFVAADAKRRILEQMREEFVRDELPRILPHDARARHESRAISSRTLRRLNGERTP